MPRETFRAPATLPLFSTSGASRTSTTSVLPFPIISRPCADVIRVRSFHHLLDTRSHGSNSSQIHDLSYATPEMFAIHPSADATAGRRHLRRVPQGDSCTATK